MHYVVAKMSKYSLDTVQKVFAQERTKFWRKGYHSIWVVNIRYGLKLTANRTGPGLTSSYFSYNLFYGQLLSPISKSLPSIFFYSARRIRDLKRHKKEVYVYIWFWQLSEDTADKSGAWRRERNFNWLFCLSWDLAVSVGKLLSHSTSLLNFHQR
jgi:hypothetical protein